MVRHYQTDSDGLAHCLTIACPRMTSPATHGLSYKDEWEIDRSTLQFQKKLGQGNFGEVWEGLWNGTTPVAIKTLREGERQILKHVCPAGIVQNA